MNLPRLLSVLLCLLFATGSHAVTIYFLKTGGHTLIDNKQYANSWGMNCDEVKKRFAQNQGASSVSGNCYTLSYYLNGWKTNKNLTYTSITCAEVSRPFNNSPYGYACKPVDELPGECECVAQSGCDSLSQQTEHAECYDAITSEQSNDHFISSFDDSGTGCPVYNAECGPLTDSCSHPAYANHPTCTDFCDLPENLGDRSCKERECYLNPDNPFCGPPTPDECAGSSAAGDPFLGCADWCESNARYATYPQCSSGGVPSTPGVMCATEMECLEQAQVQNERICEGATGYDWQFDNQTYRWSYECTFDNGGSAGSDFEGDWSDNTSDNVNTPDRTTDNTPDNTPESDQLDVADNQVEALNNANKNLNAIESLTHDTNDSLHTISGTLDEIKAAIEAQNSDGSGGTVDVDLAGVESRLDTLNDNVTNPNVDMTNYTETSSDLEQTIDVSTVQFDDSGFLADRSCPAPYSIQVLSSTFTISFQPFCELAVLIGNLILAFAYFWAARIFMKELM